MRKGVSDELDGAAGLAEFDAERGAPSVYDRHGLFDYGACLRGDLLILEIDRIAERPP